MTLDHGEKAILQSRNQVHRFINGELAGQSTRIILNKYYLNFSSRHVEYTICIKTERNYLILSFKKILEKKASAS